MPRTDTFLAAGLAKEIKDILTGRQIFVMQHDMNRYATAFTELQNQITAMVADLRTRLEIIDDLREELMNYEMREDRQGAAAVSVVYQQMGWRS